MNNQDIYELYNLACKVGETFRNIRAGEEHPKETEVREALHAAYKPLALKIDKLYHEAQLQAAINVAVECGDTADIHGYDGEHWD